jgi:predicted phosphoribosyltransferase
MQMRFRDHMEAGQLLAKKLTKYPTVVRERQAHLAR